MTEDEMRQVREDERERIRTELLRVLEDSWNMEEIVDAVKHL